MLEYIERAMNSIKDVTEDEYSRNKDIQDMSLRRVEVIGEIAKRVSPEIKDKNTDIQWKDIAGARDVIAHDYDGVDFGQVWEILTNDIPKLKPQIEKILSDLQTQE